MKWGTTLLVGRLIIDFPVSDRFLEMIWGFPCFNMSRGFKLYLEYHDGKISRYGFFLKMWRYPSSIPYPFHVHFHRGVDFDDGLLACPLGLWYVLNDYILRPANLTMFYVSFPAGIAQSMNVGLIWLGIGEWPQLVGAFQYTMFDFSPTNHRNRMNIPNDDFFTYMFV